MPLNMPQPNNPEKKKKNLFDLDDNEFINKVKGVAGVTNALFNNTVNEYGALTGNAITLGSGLLGQTGGALAGMATMSAPQRDESGAYIPDTGRGLNHIRQSIDAGGEKGTWLPSEDLPSYDKQMRNLETAGEAIGNIGDALLPAREWLEKTAAEAGIPTEVAAAIWTAGVVGAETLSPNKFIPKGALLKFAKEADAFKANLAKSTGVNVDELAPIFDSVKPEARAADVPQLAAPEGLAPFKTDVADNALEKSYHGTPEQFDEFDIAKANSNDPDDIVNGIWFTTDRSEAEAAGRFPWGRPNATNPRVIEATIDLKKPASRADVTAAAKEARLRIGAGGSTDTIQDTTRQILVEQGFDGFVRSNVSVDAAKLREAGELRLSDGKTLRVESGRPDMPQGSSSVELYDASGGHITGYEDIEDAVKQLTRKATVVFDTSRITQHGKPGALADRLQPIANRVEAEKRWADGEDIYAINDLDGDPIKITDRNMLNAYQPDQLGSAGVADNALVGELRDVGAKIDDGGMVTVYHATTKESADQIVKSGRMKGDEGSLFFSTKPDGEITGYGDVIIETQVPASRLQLDDVFSDEAHVSIAGNASTDIGASGAILRTLPVGKPRIVNGVADNALSNNNQRGSVKTIDDDTKGTNVLASAAARSTMRPEPQDVEVGPITTPGAKVTEMADRVGTTGKYRGSPEINSPQKLGALRKDLESSLERGVEGRDWYENSSQTAEDLTAGRSGHGDQYVAAIARTSADTAVSGNAGFAIKGYNQLQTGDPINTGRYPQNMGKDIEGMRPGGPGYAATDKTGPFAEANMVTRLSPEQRAQMRPTNDLWMARAFNYRRKNPDTGEMEGWTSGLGEAQHRFMDKEINRLVEVANKKKIGGFDDWTPEKVQASIWVDTKHRWEGKGFENANTDFSTGLNDRTINITSESAPSTDLNHLTGVTGNPEGAAILTDAQNLALTDEAGRNVFSTHANALTRPQVEGQGYYQGQTNPVAVNRILGGTETGAATLDPASRKLAETVGSIEGMVKGQESVGYNFLRDAKKASDRNAAIGPQRDVAEVQTILDESFGGAVIATPSGGEGIRYLVVDDVPDNWQKTLKGIVGKDIKFKQNSGDLLGNQNFDGYKPSEYLKTIDDTVAGNMDEITRWSANEMELIDDDLAKAIPDPGARSKVLQDTRKALSEGGIAKVRKLVEQGVLPVAVLAALVGLSSAPSQNALARSET